MTPFATLICLFVYYSNPHELFDAVFLSGIYLPRSNLVQKVLCDFLFYFPGVAIFFPARTLKSGVILRTSSGNLRIEVILHQIFPRVIVDKTRDKRFLLSWLTRFS